MTHRAMQRVACALTVLLLGSGAAAEPPASVCQQDAAYRRLDFWIGRWNVLNARDGSRAGTSTLAKILNGCAITVDWQEADGSGEVRELFYYQKAKKLWRQVWISDAGPTKERALVDVLPNGAIRFEGEVLQLDGGSHLDRSTITPLTGGRIHQLIEISRDGGKTWQTTFDAEYRRRH